MTQNHKVLVLAAMHRSGTSLTARWLQSCGLNIGDQLVPGGVGNDEGHFEDLEIVRLHEKILADNHLNYKVIPSDSIIVNNQRLSEINQLVEQRKTWTNWSFKDPRTCLFLSTWEEALQQPYYLVVFRKYDLVANSIYNREYKKLGDRRNFIMKYLQRKNMVANKQELISQNVNVWCRYNSDILNHLETLDRERYLVIELDNILNNEERIISFLNANNFQLKAFDISNLYKPSKMSQKESLTKISDYPNAEKIYKRLKILEKN